MKVKERKIWNEKKTKNEEFPLNQICLNIHILYWTTEKERKIPNWWIQWCVFIVCACCCFFFGWINERSFKISTRIWNSDVSSFRAFYCLQFWCWTKWERHHWMLATFMLISIGRWVMTELLMISPLHKKKLTISNETLLWSVQKTTTFCYLRLMAKYAWHSCCVIFFLSSGNFHLSKTMLRKNPLNRTDLKWFAQNKWHGRWLTSIRLGEDDWVNEKILKGMTRLMTRKWYILNTCAKKRCSRFKNGK